MIKLNAIALFLTTYKIQITLVMLLVRVGVGVATGDFKIPEDIQRQIEAQLAMLAAGLGFLAISLAKALENIKAPNNSSNRHHIVSRTAFSAWQARAFATRLLEGPRETA